MAIYRLITSKTVEEWIYQRQESFDVGRLYFQLVSFLTLNIDFTLLSKSTKIYKHNVAQHVLSEDHQGEILGLFLVFQFSF